MVLLLFVCSIFYTTINNAMVINKKAGNISKFCFTSYFFLFKFVETVSLLFDLASMSIISSHIMTELSIILAKYFQFLQLHIAGYQI